MADRPVSPLPPTTRDEPDFADDLHEQETGTVSSLGHEELITKATPSPNRKNVSFQDTQADAPPAKPPRPLSPQQQAENTLIEAFPSVDTKVVKAVLLASGGQVEPAFNALLGMSDPDFQPEEAQHQAPPRQPPRPAKREPMSQLEADEAYARQLADQYNTESSRGQTHYNQREPGRRGMNKQPTRYAESTSPERNFFDDELPEIGRNIQQGFFETQKKVNSWITTFKKKIDGEDDEDEEDLYTSSVAGSRQNTRQNFGPSQSAQIHGIQKQATHGRKSSEGHRYDADPHVLDVDEFDRLELRDTEDASPPPQPPRTSSRRAPNPDLFKPTDNSLNAKPPQSGPVDEVDAADRAEKGSKKWQPLTSAAPQPEEENDPFSLGDDDEAERGEDTRKEDTARLKEKARNSISAGVGGEAAKGLEESGRSGTKDAEMERILSGTGKE